MAESNNKNSQKKSRPSHATPKGAALFAHITEPDYGSEKFPIPAGQYSVTLSLSAADSDKLKASLAAELKEAHAYMEEQFAGMKRISREKHGSPSFTPVCTPEYDQSDEPTGNFRWRFKTAAFVENRNTGRKQARTVPIFDSMNQRIRLKEEPGNGSIIRVNFVAAPYFVEGQAMGGLSLYLNAVQVIELRKSGERSAADYGFSEEEGGFSGHDEGEEEDMDNIRPVTPSEDDDADF